MHKTKGFGMQRLAREGEDRILPRLVQRAQAAFLVPAVKRIADQRVAEVGHMDADLVRSPGFELTFDKRRDIGKILKEPVAGERQLAAVRSEERRVGKGRSARAWQQQEL